ncbi:MAG: hypothetical protein M1833_003953 [Piccolia ochrophora]|nr:MAG: hypothetical protein M1833_003953 [Piccolia ochrophora]
MSLSLSASPSNTRVELQVGERRFTTLATTLSAGSTFFASLLSERWEDSRSADGSFFIDADPDLFAHILRYLRRGVLPVVFDKIRGFDHAFYQELEAEAVYFGIEPLHEWIKDEGYLLAVTIQYSMEEVKSQGSVVSNDKVTVSGNTERSYYPTWETERLLRKDMCES